MEISSRGSMNTSLRNAKIFEDDSDDEWSEMDTKSRDDVVSANNINQESKTDHNTVDNKCIVKTEIKQELFDEDTNFPINREAFKNIQIKKEVLDELTSPVKIDPYDNSDSNSRKSFKSTKITSYRKRDSPYKTVFERLEPSPSKLLSKLDFDEREEQPRKSSRRTEIETDPLVLSRRQKQIDYGKNTIGYDEYIRAVPKLERKLTDPQTPNKNIKYSRRGWDGLIKQWRLKLHKYDPDNDA